MPTPCNKAAVLRFIGMVNHLFPFCNHLSAAIQPLRNLTQNGVLLSWSKAQDDAFAIAKDICLKIGDTDQTVYSYQRTQAIKTCVVHNFNLMNTAD